MNEKSATIDSPASLVLDDVVVAGVDDLSARTGAPWASVWLAITAALVHRYTGRDDVTIGIPPAQVTIALAGDLSFEHLLRRSYVVPEMTDRRAVRFILQSADSASLLLPRMRPSAADDDGSPTTIALTITTTERVRVAIEDNAGWIDAEVAVNMLRHLSNIARHVSAAPAARLYEVRMLDPEERDRLRALMAGPDVGYPYDPVHVEFERVVSRNPDAVALIYNDTTFSFGAVNARANRLARRLRANGVGPEVFVGLCVERTPGAVVAILGILKAGGAYVPLDPAYPGERLAEMIADAQPRLIVGTKKALRSLPADAPPSFDIDDIDDADDPSPDDNLPNQATLDNAAYLIYTSGSTGRPKAVVLTHRSILSGLNHPPFQRDDPTEISCLNSSFSVGFTTARLFLPLLSGLRLVIFPDGVERELTQLVRAWEEAGITNLGMVTPLLRSLLGLGPDYTSRLGRVRRVVVGGDMMTSELVAAFNAAMPAAALNHGYAATEIGGAGIVHERLLESGAGHASVGTPFPNVGSSRVDLQACKLEYSIVSPK